MNLLELLKMHKLNEASEICKAIRDCKYLTRTERRKAVKAYKANLNKYRRDNDYPEFNPDNLRGSFIFNNTPEGHEYWANIDKVIKEGI